MAAKIDMETVRQESSMTYWFPKLESTGVRVPDTEFVEVRGWDEATGFKEGHPVPDVGPVKRAIMEVGGPPAFIRTDQASDKHGMESASRIREMGDGYIDEHLFKLGRFNKLASLGGLPWTHIVAREWLDLKHEFTAFEHTPIASELRFFIHDGEVHDYGFYWPAEAIVQHRHHEGGLRGDWETLHGQVAIHAMREAAAEVWQRAEEVADEFDGYWSVDFAETADGDWYAIDMARGEMSWHPETVEKPEGLGE